MFQSSTPRIRFAGPTRLPLEASFDSGRLTSDGGLPWLSDADAHLDLCAAFAACLPEWRRLRIQHSLTDGGTQVRAHIDQATVEEYADALQAGAIILPIVVFADSTGFLACRRLSPPRCSPSCGQADLPLRYPPWWPS